MCTVHHVTLYYVQILQASVMSDYPPPVTKPLISARVFLLALGIFKLLNYYKMYLSRSGCYAITGLSKFSTSDVSAAIMG